MVSKITACRDLAIVAVSVGMERVKCREDWGILGRRERGCFYKGERDEREVDICLSRLCFVRL